MLALANGEIAQYPVDDPSSEWDVVGAFEGGLQAAEWSPDGSLLMLATGNYLPLAHSLTLKTSR